MKAFSQTWATALRANRQRIMLVTIDPTGRHPVLRENHPALDPTAIRLTSDRDLFTQSMVEVEDSHSGRVVPFYPYIGNDLNVSRSLSVAELRANIASLQVSVAGDPAFARQLGALTNATVRVDLWTHGVDLADVMPLLAGRVVGDAVVDFDGGTASFEVSDGDPLSQSTFPAQEITRYDFPDAPQESIGKTIPAIFNTYPDRVICAPISADRRRYVVQSWPWAKLPTSVERGGVPVSPSMWSLRDSITPQSRLRYLELQFDESSDQIAAGANNAVSVSGGIGAIDQHPVRFLAEFSGVPLDQQSHSRIVALGTMADVSSLNGSQVNAYDLISKRLAPQLGFAATQELMQTHLVPLRYYEDGPQISLGSELIFHTLPSWERSSVENVFNSVEVLCGRDVFGGNSPLYRVVRNPGYQSRIRHDQVASASKFGHRHTEFEALDLAVRRNPETGEAMGSELGEDIADLIGYLYAFPFISMQYAARPDFGYAVERGDCFRLTDSTYGISDVSCQVVDVTLGAGIPLVTLSIRQVGET